MLLPLKVQKPLFLFLTLTEVHLCAITPERNEKKIVSLSVSLSLSLNHNNTCLFICMGMLVWVCVGVYAGGRWWK